MLQSPSAVNNRPFRAMNSRPAMGNRIEGLALHSRALFLHRLTLPHAFFPSSRMRLAGRKGNGAGANPERANLLDASHLVSINQRLPGHCQVTARSLPGGCPQLTIALKAGHQPLGRFRQKSLLGFHLSAFQVCPECLLRNRKDVFKLRPAYVKISLMSILANSNLWQSPQITCTMVLANSSHICYLAVFLAGQTSSVEELTARTAVMWAGRDCTRVRL
jgi:hypothetical protein